MAVWIYAYGRNGLKTGNKDDYTGLLNSVALDEIKILDSIAEARKSGFPVRQHFTDNRAAIEDRFRSMTDEVYQSYLTSIGFPRIGIDKIVDHFIADGEKREQEKAAHFRHAYVQFEKGHVKSEWERAGDDYFINKLCFFGAYDGLRINMRKDLVQISGPSPVCSVYSTFQRTISAASRAYYHHYFKRLCRAFESDFILYAHEWSGLDEDGNEHFDYALLREQADWLHTSSDTIHTMDRFYYEQLQP